MLPPETSQIVPIITTTAIGLGMAFIPRVRQEILRRDYWTCQAETCLGVYMNMGKLGWNDGWMLNASHYPELHQREPDSNMDHGRCLCVHCHIIEEIERENHSGAGMLYDRQTIRNKTWRMKHMMRDQKPPMAWYYDFVGSSDAGRYGLADAYKERFKIR